MANAATVEQNWLIVDAENQTLGRFASQVAMLVRGKHKTTFTPHVNCGDHVIVINAEKIRLTGKKWKRRSTSGTAFIQEDRPVKWPRT